MAALYEVLEAFSSTASSGPKSIGMIESTLFTNSLLDKLVGQGHQPEGMRAALDRVAIA